MKILITGIAGFIASNIASELLIKVIKLLVLMTYQMVRNLIFKKM